EAPPANAELAEHLRTCERCSKELEARKLLRNRLQMAARGVATPPWLETRIRSNIRKSESRGVWSRYFLPVGAALLVSLARVVTCELGHLRMTAASQESYIATLSGRVADVMKVGLGDHVHCTVFRKFPKNPPSLEEMTEKLGPDYAGLLPLVKDRMPSDMRIIMAHRCGYHGRKFVHLALQGDSKLVSLVISLKREGESFS